MHYTLAHDDGQSTHDLDDADVILVGPSRTSKTPTCVYLANRGVRAANVPLVPQVPPPVSPQPYPGFAPAPSAPGYGAYPNTGVPAYPNTGAPQYPAPSQPFQPGQNGWIPAQPTSNPQGGSFVFPGQPQAVPTFPPAQPYPR